MLSLQEVCAESYDAITIEPEVIRITGRNRQTQLLITGQRKDAHWMTLHLKRHCRYKTNQ